MKFKKLNLHNTNCWVLLLIFLSLTILNCVKIKIFLPQGGQAGSEIEIIGSGFSSTITENEVNFGTLTAHVLYASSETLRVRVPDGATRAKIKVTYGRFSSAESKYDFIPLPDYIQYKKFRSSTLSTTAPRDIYKGYWIMYPPSFSDNGRKFPVIYALHGYNFDRNVVTSEIGELLAELGLLNIGANDEHSWLFAINRAGVYFPIIARCLMESNSVDEFRTMLKKRLTAIAGSQDLDHIDEIVDAVIYYLPEDPNSWISNLAEMIIVMPDGDNSWYNDRLGPPEGRNEQGIGAESIFPRNETENPAGRFDLGVTGWYEKYVLQDLFQQVEEEAIGLDKLVEEDRRRFIMGISMGGYGSLKLALKHPDMFVAVASLSGAPKLISQNLGLINKILPEILDVFGSAPLNFSSSESELQANVHLDNDYISQNNPIDIIQSIDEIDLEFFIEIGTNDIIEIANPGTIDAVRDFINILREKGIPVEGGIIPAASSNEPGNGGANHVPEFWRTRFGTVLKFFSDAYQR